MSDRSFTACRSEAAAKRNGMIAMCVAMALLPIGDAISKLLTSVATPFDVTVWRTVAQAVFFLPVAFLMRQRLSGNMFSLPAVASGALVVVVLFCLITAFETMPIATAIAIFFIEPLLLTILARPFLGERAGPRRYAAVAVGLIGALIVIKPNFAVFGPVVLLPVLAALAYAFNMIVVRKATRTRSALSLQLGATFSSAAVMLFVHLATSVFWREGTSLSTVPGWAVGAVLGAGALAALTFLLITFAFRNAEASLLAPLQYLEIVGATLLGFLVFGNFPDTLTWLGTAIILGAGVYVFRRERQAQASSGH